VVVSGGGVVVSSSVVLISEGVSSDPSSQEESVNKSVIAKMTSVVASKFLFIVFSFDLPKIYKQRYGKPPFEHWIVYHTISCNASGFRKISLYLRKNFIID
jgi:hypothetical protein